MIAKYFLIFSTIYTAHCSLNYENEFRLDQPFYESSPMIPEYYDYPLIFFKNKKTASGLSIDNWVPRSGMLLYLHHRDFNFILQRLTTSKMRLFHTLKLSQFHKAKNFWTKNWWSSGIMSNFLGEVFYVFGVKKYISVRTESCIKEKRKKQLWYLEK